MPRLLESPHEGLAELAAEYGDIVLMSNPKEHIVLITNADYIEHVLYRNHQNYDKKTARWQGLRQLLGDGLLTADGDVWRRQRQRMQPAFHQDCMDAFARAVVVEAQRTSRIWSASAAAGEMRDVFPDMLSLSARAVVRAAFGEEVEAKADAIIAAVADTHEYLNPTALANLLDLPIPVRHLTVPGFRRFRAALITLREAFDDVIRHRLESGRVRTDLLGMMMAARDDETAEPMSVEQLRDEMMTILIAGHDPGIGTAWGWYWLSQFPEVEGRLHAELDSVLGGRLPTYEDLPRLEYTRMVFNEAIRLSPPIWAIERRARNEDLIDGYRIPRGATVIASPYVMHHHPRYWDHPERFNPLRFLPEEEQRRPAYTYFPFGGGARLCIGYRIGLLEGQLMLAVLAQSFAPRLKPGHPVLASPRVSFRPKFGLPMTTQPRRAPAVSAAGA